MKIDESCIEHNALGQIKDVIEWVYGAREDELKECAPSTLTQIAGILLMVEPLKEVLKV